MLRVLFDRLGKSLWRNYILCVIREALAKPICAVITLGLNIDGMIWLIVCQRVQQLKLGESRGYKYIDYVSWSRSEY